MNAFSPITVAAAATDTPIFEASLSPYRSVGPHGTRIVTAIAIGVGTVYSMPMLLLGLWPVVPYIAASVAFLIVLIHSFARASDRSQHIRVDQDGVVVRAFDHRRRMTSEHQLPLYGLTLERETDPDYGLRALRFVLRGKTIEVGCDLSPDERADVADRLEGAMRAAGCPPWCRERRLPGRNVNSSETVY